MLRTRKLAIILGTLASMLTLVVVPVAAEASSSSSSASSGSSTTIVGTLREHAKEMLLSERQHGIMQSAELRQKACVQRQDSINNREHNYAVAAERHLTVFNDILTKVQNFYSSKKLNVTNYPSLLAAAQAKQTDAQAAVDALKALDVKIDCTQLDPAQTVATIKTAVSNARSALDAYRAAIKNIVVALQGASSAQSSNSSNTGSQQ